MSSFYLKSVLGHQHKIIHVVWEWSNTDLYCTKESAEDYYTFGTTNLRMIKIKTFKTGSTQNESLSSHTEVTLQHIL